MPEEHPGLLHLPLLAPPGVLVGRERTAGVSVCGTETIYFGKHPTDVARDLGATAITTTINWDVTALARLLAKIGYGFAVVRMGLLPREQIPLLPLILGTSDDASFWLGSAQFRLDTEAKGPAHALGVAWIPDPVDATKKWLIARVKLFVPSGATGYEIVVCPPQGSAAQPLTAGDAKAADSCCTMSASSRP